MPNLTLYSTAAFLILDSDGHRILAKYYRPKGSPYSETKGLSTLKEQKAFEKGLYEKTKKAGGDIILFEGYPAVYKHASDLIFYLIGNPEENELILQMALSSFYDALNNLLRSQVEKRAVLEYFDLVMLCLDETIDDGVIVETDSSTIASRVSRPRTDPTEIVINEQTLTTAFSTIRDRVAQRISSM
ncbi:coatomer protein [Schizopora paradoxa]|uniref:Coatomer subunit zeta n=1 Tax=Schizopora paradoxa TaxID=27342 RepID=A0A0H2RY30_9AGAM|nr:coatomer protein [Schizopora paradoxa]